jgi:CheY-like chemotaxis protein
MPIFTPMAKKILVVEDVKSSRSPMVIVLRSLGYETLEAETGADAIQKAFFDSPNLIMMDLGFPDITGIDAARTIKENPGSAHIPLIACTAWEKDRLMQQATDVGIAAYLVKPVGCVAKRDDKTVYPVRMMKEALEP